MSIRNKITLYFSIVTNVMTCIAFVFIYFLFSENRENEFQLRQKEKISTTLRFLTEIKQTEDELIEALDQLTIHDLYDEKLLLFNAKKELIYSSIDDTPVAISKKLLLNLSSSNKWIETKDGLYDVVATYIESNNTPYYGISKAYDTFGYSKLRYLKYILIFSFISISILIITISFYLSKKITQPLLTITNTINNYNFENDFTPIHLTETKNEVAILATQFNKLMKRMNEVYSFQKHAIHHISHELKTPIAILVSNFERLEKETNLEKLHQQIIHQKEDTKNLSEIINSLLELAKAESSSTLIQEKVRLDELIFDVADELKIVHPNFLFSIEYIEANDENDLVIIANKRLIKAALMNLMLNCILYSTNNNAKISVENIGSEIKISFENEGVSIQEKENQLMFKHFFRGENSVGKRGFGLGLVFIDKIITLHKGRVKYTNPHNNLNIFTVILPLR